MKRVAAAAVAVVCLLLFGCSWGGEYDADGEFVDSNADAVIYGDTLYYNRTSLTENYHWSGFDEWEPIGLLYQDLGNVHPRGVPLYGDELMGKSENPFRTISEFKMLVDPTATEQNGGEPVFILAQDMGYAEEDPDHPNRTNNLTRIISYNTRTRSFGIICDGVIGRFLSFSLCGDTIVYETLDFEEGISLYKVDRRGGKPVFLGKAEGTELDVVTIYGGKLYYTLPDSGGVKLYTCDTSTASHEHIADIPCGFPSYFLAIRRGEIYYSANRRAVDTPDGIFSTTEIFDIVRITDDGGIGTVVTDVESAKMYKDEIYYVPHNGNGASGGRGEISFRRYCLDGGSDGPLFTYRFPDGQEHFFYVLAVSDEYIFCRDSGPEDGDGAGAVNVCIDKRTGSAILIPDEKIQ